MKLYGIADAKQLVLEFDGDRVGDAQSPRDLGIEDDDLIEVKVSHSDGGREWALAPLCGSEHCDRVMDPRLSGLHALTAAACFCTCSR